MVRNPFDRYVRGAVRVCERDQLAFGVAVFQDGRPVQISTYCKVCNPALKNAGFSFAKNCVIVVTFAKKCVIMVQVSPIKNNQRSVAQVKKIKIRNFHKTPILAKVFLGLAIPILLLSFGK